MLLAKTCRKRAGLKGPAKKVTKKPRYPIVVKKGLGITFKVITTELFDIYPDQWKFIPTRRKSEKRKNITEEKIKQICAVPETELLKNPERYRRLNAIDFWYLWHDLEQKKVKIESTVSSFYFSVNPLIQLRTDSDSEVYRYFICMERNEYGIWVFKIYEQGYVRDSGAYNVICLDLEKKIDT